jgi:hypothetical protein
LSLGFKRFVEISFKVLVVYFILILFCLLSLFFDEREREREMPNLP